jgi:hypothetical protein
LTCTYEPGSIQHGWVVAVQTPIGAGTYWHGPSGQSSGPLDSHTPLWSTKAEAIRDLRATFPGWSAWDPQGLRPLPLAVVLLEEESG